MSQVGMMPKAMAPPWKIGAMIPDRMEDFKLPAEGNNRIGLKTGKQYPVSLIKG